MSLTRESENSQRLSISLLESLQEKKQRDDHRRIRASLTEFARASGYEPAEHHRLLICELEALERGDTDTLIVEMPPGSAKSTYVNFLFPAWFISRHPDQNVITASHSTELAERWGRKTRNLLTISSLALNVSLSSDNQAAGRWATAKGGEYYAVGVGVGIAGFRADLGIIDDPFGSREDAESKPIRDKRWEWYIDDFNGRLKPNAKRVIMHTRWHDDDLAARVKRQLKALGFPARVLTVPAEALPNDPLGRSVGTMLWDDPDGYDYGSFLRKRKLESDARTWASLYQQNPVPDDGQYFKKEWFQPVDKLPPLKQLRLYGASDYAVTSDGGDYTVHGIVGIDYDDNPWLCDVWRKQAASDEWVEAWCDLVLKWKPTEWAEETGQIKSGVGPFLDQRSRERHAYCVRTPFPTRGDKAVRAQSIRGRIAQRGLRYPANAPWAADVIGELLRFPFGVNDDVGDMLGLIGQLLDKVYAPQRAEKKERKVKRDWFEDKDDEADSWKVA